MNLLIHKIIYNYINDVFVELFFNTIKYFENSISKEKTNIQCH